MMREMVDPEKFFLLLPSKQKNVFVPRETLHCLQLFFVCADLSPIVYKVNPLGQLIVKYSF